MVIVIVFVLSVVIILSILGYFTMLAYLETKSSIKDENTDESSGSDNTVPTTTSTVANDEENDDNISDPTPSSMSDASKKQKLEYNDDYKEKQKREDEVLGKKKVTLDTFLYDLVIRIPNRDINLLENYNLKADLVTELIEDRFIDGPSETDILYTKVYNSSKKRLTVKNFFNALITNFQDNKYKMMLKKIGNGETLTGTQNLNNVSIFIDRVIEELISNHKKYKE